MGKKKTNFEKLSFRLGKNSNIGDYSDEIKILENEYKVFSNNELSHLVRLIENGTTDLIKYFKKFKNLTKKERLLQRLDIYVIRYGSEEKGKIEYEKYLNKMKSGVKKAYSEMTEEEYKKKKPQYIEFYLERYTPKEAKEKFEKYLQERSKISKKAIKKSLKKMREDPSLRPTNLEYYVKKYDGDIKKAKIAYKDRQTTNSLEKYIKRFGAKEGYKNWKRKNRKWQRTLKQKSKKEILDMNAKKFTGVCPNNVSKSSIQFFEKLEKDFPQLSFQYGGKCDELCIIYDDTRRYYYDCYIKELNLIIEYHGVLFHPKPGDYNWKHYNGKDSYREARKKDLKKKKVAIENGFKYLEFYSDVKYDKVFKKIEEFINE